MVVRLKPVAPPPDCRDPHDLQNDHLKRLTTIVAWGHGFPGWSDGQFCSNYAEHKVKESFRASRVEDKDFHSTWLTGFTVSSISITYDPVLLLI